VADDANLVKNTTQRVVAKALGAMENYYEYDDFGKPSHTKDRAYPLRANFTEGYNLSLTDDGDVAFRISAKPYKHVKGVLKGSDAHLDILRTALESDGWKIGTAEALFHNDTPELHVNVTNTKQTVRDKQDSRTVVGVDVNEDNVALTALSEDGIKDSLVIDFPEIKFERHRYFTMRKRIQNTGKGSVHDTLEGREQRFVRDLHHPLGPVLSEGTEPRSFAGREDDCLHIKLRYRSLRIKRRDHGFRCTPEYDWRVVSPRQPFEDLLNLTRAWMRLWLRAQRSEHGAESGAVGSWGRGRNERGGAPLVARHHLGNRISRRQLCFSRSVHRIGVARDLGLRGRHSLTHCLYHVRLSECFPRREPIRRVNRLGVQPRGFPFPRRALQTHAESQVCP
jgi:hypothetical protein